jgi:IclR family pca regulon transcriptional regulator
MGKVLLAFLPRAVLDDALAEATFERRGPNTITGRRALERELERVRERGLAVNNEELAYGLRSFAAPVRSQNGDVVAAINIAVHRSLVPLDEQLGNLGAPLLQTAAAISARIGFGAVAP